MSELYEKILTTDRWPNRAISPLPFDEVAEDLPVVVIHPGWGKRPEMLTPLLQELCEAGFRAMGLDTRYGYTDQMLTKAALLRQRIHVGDTNPFFDNVNTERNRYFYRRPTGLLQACVDLGITECSYVGHSEGARIGLTAALADQSPVSFDQMVLVNGVGTGAASGANGLLKTNIQAVKQRRQAEANNREALLSFRDSTIHFITHPRRSKREADVINDYDAWPDIAQLALTRTDQITVMNAQDDYLINFNDAQKHATEHPEVHFVPTVGSHSNIYKAAVRELIVGELVK